MILCFILLIIGSTLTTSSWAFDSEFCWSTDKVAEIGLKWDQNQCKVTYRWNNGKPEPMWLSDVNADSSVCDKKVEEIIEMHKGWGWQCASPSQYKILTENLKDSESKTHSSLASGSNKEVTKLTGYKDAALVGDMIARTHAVKSLLNEHYMTSNGDNLRITNFPLDNFIVPGVVDRMVIEDDGAVISENTRGTLNTIVLKFTPEFNQNGHLIKWDCRINPHVTKIKMCSYDSTLKFPI
jgi:hypothetical protein